MEKRPKWSHETQTQKQQWGLGRGHVVPIPLSSKCAASELDSKHFSREMGPNFGTDRGKGDPVFGEDPVGRQSRVEVGGFGRVSHGGWDQDGHSECVERAA